MIVSNMLLFFFKSNVVLYSCILSHFLSHDSVHLAPTYSEIEDAHTYIHMLTNFSAWIAAYYTVTYFHWMSFLTPQ